MVGVFVGEPLEAPMGVNGKRPNRDELRSFTQELRGRMQGAQDAARNLAQQG